MSNEQQGSSSRTWPAGRVPESVPRATYRVQLHKGFTFDDAAAIVDYLSELGISHLYCSPYLQASPGSKHGYDVEDPSRLNEELGGEEAYGRLCAALQKAGLRQVLDIVPNHMSIAGPGNRWWWDVLENGPSSRYATVFDVEWDPPEAKLRNTILLPVLGDHYGIILERGEITLRRDGARFVIAQGSNQWPVEPRSIGEILSEADRFGGGDEIAYLADAFHRLPVPTARDRQAILRRHRDTAVLYRQLERIIANDPAIASAIDQAVEHINGRVDMLDSLLDKQNYRLAFWRASARDLGYRRFFDVNTLVGLRTDDESVLSETHSLILRLVHDGKVDGLRIDHPDGLSNPQGYLDWLRANVGDRWIVAEKILEPGEKLPEDWPIAGTTGYDYMRIIGGVLVDPQAEKRLTDFYSQFTGHQPDFKIEVQDKKRLVLRDLMGSDLNQLTDLWNDLAERHRRYRDYSRHELHHTLREVIACFPVYRTYVRPATATISDDDRAIIHESLKAAKEADPQLDDHLLEFLRSLLLLERRGTLEDHFVTRFQQLTGPVMAKGVEDTAFYCYHRFVALNEVGGDPGIYGTRPAEFHAACQQLQAHWPTTMISTSTHDTKRGEDVRARLYVLSEMVEEWIETVQRWSKLNERHWQGEQADHAAEFLLYQTLVGAWPLPADRAVAYMEKALREGKIFTTWTEQNPAYEKKMFEFTRRIIGDPEFCQEVNRFIETIERAGWTNSLSQTLMKLTVPGVPDTYQGMELWDDSLVDPDNRRPVDYAERRRLLAETASISAGDAWRDARDGRPKIMLIRRTLELRRQRPDLFSPEAVYRPVNVKGDDERHVLAYSRGQNSPQLVVVVPRFSRQRSPNEIQATILLDEGTWRNVLDGSERQGGEVNVGQLLGQFPVALLVR